MRRGIVLALAFLVMACGVARAAVGVVDMERLIRLHPRTSSDRAILEKYVEDFEAEREERVASLQDLSEAFEELRRSSEDIGLSEKAAQDARRLAQSKFEEMRRTERDLREMAALRQRELTSQELRMRTRVVSDIRQIVARIAEERKLTLVLDSTGPGAGGYSPVIFAEKTMDITEGVIAQLLKQAPVVE